MKQLPVQMMQRFRQDEGGSIAVEFAFVAPVLLLILAGVVDIGSATYSKVSLDAQVTATAEYALLQSAPGDQEAAETLAGNLVALLQGGDLETAEVIVNNAVRANYDGSSVANSFLGGDADMCYCPDFMDGAIVWGAPVDCETPCTNGDSAGRFVQISATAEHVAIFPGYSFLDGDRVKTSAVLRLQ